MIYPPNTYCFQRNKETTFQYSNVEVVVLKNEFPRLFHSALRRHIHPVMLPSTEVEAPYNNENYRTNCCWWLLRPEINTEKLY